MLICEEYLRPTSLAEALRILESAPPGTRIAAGATDLLPWAREGRAGDVALPKIVDVSRVGEIAGWEDSGSRVRIGAGVALQRFLDDEELARRIPCMTKCAVWFADDQIREQATVVGNIVNASPAADCTPPMIALNGVVEIARLEHGGVREREMPLAEFALGPGEVDLKDGEIVTAVTCDSMLGGGGSFQKVGQRRSLAISTVCAAACVRLDPTAARFEDVRLALGGIGPVPVRLGSVEESLKGQPAEQSVVERRCQLPSELIASRTRREYRRSVSSGFAVAAISEALVSAREMQGHAMAKEAANA